jgi:ubiquinone/menaquinone biosynthesis C-methylase UbiE
MADEPIYTLGRTQAETERLVTQAELFEPATRMIFEYAGIKPGMKVLDLGSGAGDVAILAARMVGPAGSVTGVDVNGAALATARDRAAAAGLHNVAFIEGDFRTVDLPNDFDALVGRLVLMYLADPVAGLKDVLRHVRPGGLVAFQELDVRTLDHYLTHFPGLHLWRKVWDWFSVAVEKSGNHTELGYRLYNDFMSAGLTEPTMADFSHIGGPSWPGFEIMAGLIRSSLPLIEKFSIASAEEIDIDTLAKRLRAEAVATGSLARSLTIVGAWARKP